MDPRSPNAKHPEVSSNPWASHCLMHLWTRVTAFGEALAVGPGPGPLSAGGRQARSLGRDAFLPLCGEEEAYVRGLDKRRGCSCPHRPAGMA